jgi:hypothetical protein
MEALRQCLQNLEETIARLFSMTRSLPAGKLRDELLDELSCLDSIADAMGQAVDVFSGEAPG